MTIHDRYSQPFEKGTPVRENWSGIVGEMVTPGRDECLVRWPNGRQVWVKTGFLVVAKNPFTPEES